MFIKHSVGCLILSAIVTLIGVNVFAAAPSLVIAQVQAGGVSGDSPAAQEFISLYNNTDQDIEVTGWCLANKSVTVVCLTAPAPNVSLYLHGRASVNIASSAFKTAHPEIVIDILYNPSNVSSGSITAGSDTITLSDARGVVLDSVGWTSSLSGGMVLQRKPVVGSEGSLIDTDATTDLIKLSTLVVPPSGLYEVETIVDLCANLAGIQTTLPERYLKDDQGSCQFDICVNLAGLQLVVPAGFESLDAATCTPIPLENSVINVTELLANPSGSDTANEFIELFNPNSYDVNLKGYNLLVGPSFEKSYVLSDAVVMPAQSYLTLTNATVGFTLVNSSSRVRLVSPAGTVVSETPLYVNPADDTTWASIDGVWQFTNRPTPATANLAWLEPAETGQVLAANTSLASCGEGKYRNPLTNRCRTIATDISVLASCDADEYRSPDTNRCRKIVTATAELTACQAGYERNSETNRCRKITSGGSELAPCKAGQERNPDTNRCRNVSAISVPAAAFPVEKVADSGKAFVGWWAFGGVSAIALGYAGWEWRKELLGLLRKAGTFFMLKK